MYILHRYKEQYISHGLKTQLHSENQNGQIYCMPSFMMATTILLMFQMITLEILNNSRVTVGIVYFKNIARFSWTTITIHVLVIIVDTSAFLLDS